jgi:hypothetical protein
MSIEDGRFQINDDWQVDLSKPQHIIETGRVIKISPTDSPNKNFLWECTYFTPPDYVHTTETKFLSFEEVALFFINYFRKNK